MDARGFSSRRPRTSFRTIPFVAADAWLIALTAIGGVGILWLSAALGILHVWSGALSARRQR